MTEQRNDASDEVRHREARSDLRLLPTSFFVVGMMMRLLRLKLAMMKRLLRYARNDVNDEVRHRFVPIIFTRCRNDEEIASLRSQ